MFSTALAALPQLSYFGLFLFLVGGAVFIPIPEEITLLTAGYLVATGTITLGYGVPIAIGALLIGDTVLFLLARIGATYATKLRERVNSMGLEKTWLFSPKHPLRAVFVLRFFTGFRFIAPIYAGFEEVPWKSYIFVNGISILIYVPLMFGLGYLFHHSILVFIAGFELVRHTVFIIVLALAGSGMLPTLFRTIKKKLRKN